MLKLDVVGPIITFLYLFTFKETDIRSEKLYYAQADSDIDLDF